MYTEVKIKKFWKKLKKEGFFEEVSFEKTKFQGKIPEKGICTWLLRLNEYFGIDVKRFKDLFTKMPEVTFPINVTWIYGSECRAEIGFKDAKNTEYYFVELNLLMASNIEDLKKYFIFRRNQRIEPLVAREFHFELDENDQIALNEIISCKLNNDLSNCGETVYTMYDEETTVEYKDSETAKVITVKTKEIKGNEKKFEDILFAAGKQTGYNVIPLIKSILEIMPNETVTMSVYVSIEGEIYSGINIENHIVKEYISTEKVSEELKIVKTICSKELKNFI